MNRWGNEPTRRRAAKRVVALRTSRGASRRVTCDSLPLTASIRASAAPIQTRLRFRPTHPRLLFLRYQHVCGCTGRSSWSSLHAPRLRCGLMQCPPRPSPHSRHTCCIFVIVDLCAEGPAETLIHELFERTTPCKFVLLSAHLAFVWKRYTFSPLLVALADILRKRRYRPPQLIVTPPQPAS
jgi:hypothetical protein